jgi:hypothetical protein
MTFSVFGNERHGTKCGEHGGHGGPGTCQHGFPSAA